LSAVFDTKIAVILRQDLATWQKLNVTAFTISGIAASVEEVTGEPYRDGSGNLYLPMFCQPVLVFEADAAKIRTAYERALSRSVPCAIFTEELFTTNNDSDNRAAVAAVPADDLRIVGLALRAERAVADRILKGLSLHR
jgi:hypothetical protein